MIRLSDGSIIRKYTSEDVLKAPMKGNTDKQQCLTCGFEHNWWVESRQCPNCGSYDTAWCPEE